MGHWSLTTPDTSVKPPPGCGVNWNHPLNRGLIACVLMYNPDELYDIVRGRRFTKGGTPEPYVGAMGESVDYNDASTEYHRYSGNILAETGDAKKPPLSISAWFNLDDVSAFHTIVSVVYSGSTAEGFRLGVNTDSKVYASSMNAGAYKHAISTTTVTVGKWHHTCLVSPSESERSVFLDAGGKHTETSTVSFSNGPNRFTMGAFDRSSIAQLMDGKIALVNVWRRELSDAEVKEDYNYPYGRPTNPRFT